MVGAVMRFLKVLIVVVTLAVIIKAGLYYDVLNLQPLPTLTRKTFAQTELFRF